MTLVTTVTQSIVIASNGYEESIYEDDIKKILTEDTQTFYNFSLTIICLVSGVFVIPMIKLFMVQMGNCITGLTTHERYSRAFKQVKKQEDEADFSPERDSFDDSSPENID